MLIVRKNVAERKNVRIIIIIIIVIINNNNNNNNKIFI